MICTNIARPSPGKSSWQRRPGQSSYISLSHHRPPWHQELRSGGKLWTQNTSLTDVNHCLCEIRHVMGLTNTMMTNVMSHTHYIFPSKGLCLWRSELSLWHLESAGAGCGWARSTRPYPSSWPSAPLSSTALLRAHLPEPRRHALPVIRSDQDHFSQRFLFPDRFRFSLHCHCIASLENCHNFLRTFTLFPVPHSRVYIYQAWHRILLIFWTSIQNNEQLKYLSLSIKCSTLLLNYF